MANPLIRKIRKPTFKSNINKSKGILDDFAVRKNMATREGTIEKVPVNDNDIVNKKYVDEISINAGIDLFGYDENSDIEGYKTLKLDPSSNSKTESIVNVSGNATAQLVGQRITETELNCFEIIKILTTGIYNVFIRMKAATANRIKFFVELYVRDSSGTETLIGTSQPTDFIGTTEMGLNTHVTITEEYPLSEGDRIVLKGYASNSSPASTDLYIYAEGDTGTRLTVRGISTPRDHSSLANLDYASSGHTGFEATLEDNQKLDWTISQSPKVIHADNYTDTTAHASLSQLDYASSGHIGFEPAKGADDNYVTDAEKIVIGNTSGVNTGDQTSSDFDHNQLTNTHNLTTDIDHNSLTNYDADKHFLQSEISIPASQISDFDTEVSNNTDVTANTAKNSFDWDYDYADLINTPTTITPQQATDITTNNAKVSSQWNNARDDIYFNTGNVNIGGSSAFEYKLTIEGDLLALGYVPSEYYHGSYSEDYIFDKLKIVIPSVADRIMVNGAVGNLIISRVRRNSSTTMIFYGYDSYHQALDTLTITDGDHTSHDWSIAW